MENHQLRPWPYEAHEAVSRCQGVLVKDVIEDEKDPIATRILELIVDLGNTVLTKRAVSDLTQ